MNKINHNNIDTAAAAAAATTTTTTTTIPSYLTWSINEFHDKLLRFQLGGQL